LTAAPTIIGIDPATHTGLCILPPWPERHSHPQPLLLDRVEMRDADEWKADLLGWAKRLAAYAPALVVIEAQHVGKGKGGGSIIPAQVAGWWFAVAQAAGLEVVEFVQPSTWQSFHGIKRRSKTQKVKTKRQGRDIASRMFGVECDREDVADAALIANWARRQSGVVVVWRG